MFLNTLQELKGYIARDFLFIALLPVSVFLVASIIILISLGEGFKTSIQRWEEINTSTQFVIFLLIIIGVFILSFLTYNFQYQVVRLFQGYWNDFPILNQFQSTRISFHDKKRKYLEGLVESASEVEPKRAKEILQLLLAYYPQSSEYIMPTQIGNILRAAEVYANDRYGIEPSVIWTRLRLLIPAETLSTLEAQKISLHTSLLLAIFSVIFVLIWGPFIVLFSNNWLLFLGCVSGWLWAWVFYKNAIQSALLYSEQIKATFDLYRQKLLESLKRPIPVTIEEEREEWKSISFFLLYNNPLPTPSTKTKTKAS